MVIEVIWRKSWRLFKAIVTLPFVVVGTLFMLVVFAVSFLWECAFEKLPDSRLQKSRH
jgi:hypothetical protein